MTKEEIRKLLGGYATNTLTESERKALFNAALDDQDLFNALQEEEALKELLADPVSRAQVAQALTQPASGRQRAGWRLRWWAWGGTVSAVAAAAIVFAVIQSRPVQKTASFEIASAERGARAVAPEPTPNVANERKEQSFKAKPVPAVKYDSSLDTDALKAKVATGSEVKLKDAESRSASPPPLATAAPASAPVGTVEQAKQSGQPGQSGQAGQSQTAGAAYQFGGQVQGQAPGAANAFRDDAVAQTQALQGGLRKGAAVGGAAVNAVAAGLRYSLLKRDPNGAEMPVAPDAELKAGDAVRLNVSTPASGFLTLSQLDPAGAWKEVARMPVAANSNYAFPSNAIAVQNGAQRFRLALEPAAAAAERLSSALPAKKAIAREAAVQDKVAVAPAPAIEFTLVGK